MLNGMLWIARSGAQWRELPSGYGPWQTVYSRFAKWRDTSILEKVFRVLASDADMENISIDSTCVKVHQNDKLDASFLAFVYLTHLGRFTKSYTQTEERATDNKSGLPLS